MKQDETQVAGDALIEERDAKDVKEAKATRTIVPMKSDDESLETGLSSKTSITPTLKAGGSGIIVGSIDLEPLPSAPLAPTSASFPGAYATNSRPNYHRPMAPSSFAANANASTTAQENLAVAHPVQVPTADEVSREQEPESKRAKGRDACRILVALGCVMLMLGAVGLCLILLLPLQVTIVILILQLSSMRSLLLAQLDVLETTPLPVLGQQLIALATLQ